MLTFDLTCNSLYTANSSIHTNFEKDRQLQTKTLRHLTHLLFFVKVIKFVSLPLGFVLRAEPLLNSLYSGRLVQNASAYVHLEVH